MSITCELTALVADKAAIVARIGPAHGAHTTPRETPVNNPPQKPLPEFIRQPKILFSLEVAPSTMAESLGTINTIPRKAIMRTATKRRLSGSKLNILTK